MYSHTSYDHYMRSGEATAAALSAVIDRHIEADPLRVADWGCGLGRVLRHLPQRYQRTGFDYNAAAIEWCQSKVAGATFSRCKLNPPLPVENNSFDVVCALSVFTHLSASGHLAWICEIERVLAPGGIVLASLHMTPRPDQLLNAERSKFDAGDLVVRGSVREGGRTFTAFHPESYVREALFEKFDLIEEPTDFFGQTLICARKP